MRVFEDQGPEAVREGDPYVCAKSRGLRVTCRHFPETRKDGDVQVMAKGKESVNAYAELSQTPAERQSKSDRAWDCYACPNQTRMASSNRVKMRKEPKKT